ncbi:MAG: cobalt ECF transporter T component CbiQ [Methanophagales archaeon ANME-1-THS]|nr:MAG: cobalt ECF transporter T component CbiQ [Methanophagales archaeon ANME-1-THS]
MSKFADKTLVEIVNYIKDAVFSERYATFEGFLQRIDPKVKFVSFMILIVATIFAHSVYIILLFFSASLILAALSRIPLRFYIPRVLIFIPIFTGIVALPYIFNIFQPYEGTPLIVIHDFQRVIELPLLRPFSRIEITREGVFWASTFLARVTTAVSYAILLMLTTRWSDILNTLSALRFPKIFVLILGMAYRYIFLLLDTIVKMLFSRKSRAVGKESSVSSWRLNAGIIGALFLKSYDMSGNIYLAMLSRGFNGDFSHLHADSDPVMKDYLFLTMVIVFCISSLVVEVMA